MDKERKGLIRAVVDANVFISATLYEGPISKLLSKFQDFYIMRHGKHMSEWMWYF